MKLMLKTTLGALLAVLALGALVAASASAAENPEFSTTGDVYGNGGEAGFYGPGGTEAVFQKSTLSGDISSTSMLTSVSLLFTGGGKEEGCENTEGTGLSVTGLDAKLGWINKAKNEVGLMFYPPKQPMNSCRWDGENVGLVGEFIGKITPVGTPTTHFTVKLSNKGNEQLPQYFEGEKESAEIFPLAYGYCNLNKKGVEECKHNLHAAIETTLEISAAKLIEIKS